MADGSLFVAGGDNQSIPETGVVNGRAGLRIYTPSTSSWRQLPDMTTNRWYPTVVTLADSRMIIIGGNTENLDFDKLGDNNNPTYEYYPAKSGSWPRELSILRWAYPHHVHMFNIDVSNNFSNAQWQGFSIRFEQN